MLTRGLTHHHRVQQQVNPTFQVHDERLVTASDRTDPVTGEAVDRTPGHVEGWARMEPLQERLVRWCPASQG